ncbi:MAG TPA: histidine kinase [Candidatus Dormibacteraeota bacterium]|nr:histidine kinase [Candidatus Dormibacteraeota bacterium]
MSSPSVGLLVLAAILAVIVATTVAAAVISGERRRRRAAASLGAIGFVRSSFATRLARGDPMDELLVQIAEALRDSLGLDSAEIWLQENNVLRREAGSPQNDPAEIEVSDQEQSIAANALVSGSAWVKTWLPALLRDQPEVPIRVVPLSVSGQLLGMIVVRRRLRPERLERDSDEILEELAREVSASVHKQRLDASLQASLTELRRQAQDLQASRARIVVAADAERRRMERDLHDGAQQYLVSIAVKARLIRQLARTDVARSVALSEELVSDVEAALDDLRTLAHGIYPPLLSSDGLGAALAAVARRATIPVHLDAQGVGRHQPEIEAAVYYCCLEALQNATKYAGDSATARISVWEENAELRFEIADDGAGFELAHKVQGAGLTNMSDRMGAVGGTLLVDSAPGSGTRVRGVVPTGA